MYTHLGKRSDFLVAIGVKVLLRVVDCHAAVDAVGQCGVLHNRHTLVGSVGVFKVHGCRPVVAVSCEKHTEESGNQSMATCLKSSENVHVVHVACSAGSVSIVALNALPPTI